MRHRYARCCRPAGVEGHITRKRIASEAGRSRVWPPSSSAVYCVRWSASGRRGAVADDARARRSDSVIVAVKPANKAGQRAAERSAVQPTAAEPVEPRAETKEMRASEIRAGRSTRISVPQALDRIRKVAKERKRRGSPRSCTTSAPICSKRRSSNSRRTQHPAWMD